MSDITFPSHYTRLDKLYLMQISILRSVTESYDFHTDTTPEGITLSALLKSLTQNFGMSATEIGKGARGSGQTILNYIAGRMPQDAYAADKRERVKASILKILDEKAKHLPRIEPDF